MADDNGERVLLYILIGFGIFGFAYLFFKDQFRRNEYKQDRIMGMSGLGSGSRLGLANPRIEELERQTEELKEKIKSYDYKLESFDRERDGERNKERIPTSKTYQLNSPRIPSRAGSISTIRTTAEDRERQKEFGMI